MDILQFISARMYIRVLLLLSTKLKDVDFLHSVSSFNSYKKILTHTEKTTSLSSRCALFHLSGALPWFNLLLLPLQIQSLLK